MAHVTSNSPAPDAAHNDALAPMPPDARVFLWNHHAALWFSLGVGLLVMQVGAYLVPAVGTRDAVIAILLGSCIGAGLLAWTAKLGADTGLASAGLMHATYGSAFARLPVLLNILQLVGWTTFELVVMREGTQAIAQQALGWDLGGTAGLVGATLLWGVVLLALLGGTMVGLVRRFVSRFGLPLVVASLLWLSWQFAARLQAQGLDAFWSRAGDGSMGLFGALDLVIAMPVSWLPLVADYARHGQRAARGRLGGAFGGTWLGYALANVWCYALGVMVVSVAGPDTSLVTALLLAQGGLVALGLVLIDELDNAYGDVYSASVSGHSLRPRWSIRRWGFGVAALCIALAMVLPMHALEPFLLKLSSVFVPLFGVILGRLGTGGAVVVPVAGTRRFDAGAAAIWILGIVAYHACAAWAPQFGAALPTLLLTLVLARVSRGSAAAAPSALAHGRG